MRLRWLLIAAVMLMALPVLAVDEDRDIPRAVVVNDEGGVQRITGVLPLRNPNIKIYTVDPVIILEDQVNFVSRDILAEIPTASQVFARLLNDFYAEGDVEYELLLPIAPQGTLLDVNFDDREDLGLQIYQVAHWDNRYGDAFLDIRDAYGWSGAYSSVSVTDDPRQLGEITGGKLVIFAPDDRQTIASGFGEDGLLFTADDPQMRVPIGWSVLNLDAEPFTLDRSNHVIVDLIEPKEAIPPDFSNLSFTEAFDALIEWGRVHYPFTEFNGTDWDALAERFRPRFVEADNTGDVQAYEIAIDELAKAIPDGHVSAASLTSNSLEQQRIAGGLGFAVRELTDGRILVNFVQPGGPAENAGIVFGAEVTAINGVPIEEAIAAVDSVNAPYSNPAIERLDQVRFVTRFPLGVDVEVTFINPGETERTVTMTTVNERASLSFSRQFVYGQAVATVKSPLEFQFLPSGYGYVSVNDFYGNEMLMIKTWEYFLDAANAQSTPGIIIDLRTNGGGFSFIGNRIASYLYDEELILGYNASYNEILGEFYYDPRFPERIQPEFNEARRYRGPVAVLVGPGCASACEFFAYALTRNERAAVVGQYGTNSIGGGVEEIPMPAGITFRIPSVRPIDPDGNIYVEGTGIQPTVLVPVTEENMATTDDIVLEAAIAYLDELIAGQQPEFEAVEAGSISIGETVELSIAAGERVYVDFNTGAGGVVNIVITSEIGAFVNILSPTGEVLADGTSPSDPGWEELELPPNFDLVLEIRTASDAFSGAFTLSIELQD
jgi:C-terminal processing protease CtpA/Prc